MAQVRQDVGAEVDWLLTYQFDQWTDLAEVGHEWDTWDKYERNDFRIEWPIVTCYMHELEEYVEQGALTPAQRERYDTPCWR